MRRARARASKRYAARARRLDWTAIKRRRDCGDLDRARYLAARDGHWDTYRDGESVETLPYQTADARHSPMRAAELAVAYWARQSGDDMGEVESIEVAS